MRILVAVHGYEPEGWPTAVARAVPSPDTSLVRVLVVYDVPGPPFTSLAPGASRRYRAALAEWRRLAQVRTEPVVDALLAGFRRPPEVVRVVASHCDSGRTIVDHARAWAAEVIIVGRATPGRVSRALLGSVHERVVQAAPCAVLVTPPEPGTGGHVFARASRAAILGGL